MGDRKHEKREGERRGGGRSRGVCDAKRYTQQQNTGKEGKEKG
jgi:hypothetical protein